MIRTIPIAFGLKLELDNTRAKHSWRHVEMFNVSKVAHATASGLKLELDDTRVKHSWHHVDMSKVSKVFKH